MPGGVLFFLRNEAASAARVEPWDDGRTPLIRSRVSFVPDSNLSRFQPFRIAIVSSLDSKRAICAMGVDQFGVSLVRSLGSPLKPAAALGRCLGAFGLPTSTAIRRFEARCLFVAGEGHS